jgi:F-type H+-transporting ATPase subunit b
MGRHVLVAVSVLSFALGLPFGIRSVAAETPPADQAKHGATADAAHGGTEAAHGATQESPNILEFKPTLAVSTILVFAILLGVLSKYAWGPLSKALHDREHNMEATLRAAEQAREEADRLLAEHRVQMTQAGDQVRAILEEARRDAQTTAEDILKKAQGEAEAARQRAERDIHTARDQALLEIWSKTADLAVSAAGRVLAKQLSSDDHRRLIEAARNELPAAPNGHGGHAS